MKRNMTVEELIKTRYMKDISRVVAGQSGLDRVVDWVYMLELRDVVADSVDCNDLILTTGLCNTDKEIAVKFLEGIIEAGASGLCIETSLQYYCIDEELLRIADEHDFPLIEIFAASRLKDISKGLNRIITESELRGVKYADYYDRELGKIEGKDVIRKRIRYTADFLNIEIAYIPGIGQQYATSESIKKDSCQIIKNMPKEIEGEQVYCRENFAVKSLNIGDKNCGALIFRSCNSKLTDFDITILGRLANRIRGELIDEIRANEEKIYNENSWIANWLGGELRKEKVYEKLARLGMNRCYREYCVCTCVLNKNILFGDFIADMTLCVRRCFEEQDLYVVGYINGEMIHYIVFNNDRGNTVKKLKAIINSLTELKNNLIDYSETEFVIGKVVNESEEIDRSYRTSVEYIDYALNNAGNVTVFDELHFERVLYAISEMQVVDDCIKDYLGELVSPQNYELLHTLAAYYDCNCSKQKTAEKLYIARQTLYFRLQKIRTILGNDYDRGEYRFALEFACKAFMHKHKEWQP